MRALAFITLLLSSTSASAASPVILVPGFMGWRDLAPMGPYFIGLADALRAEGADVYPIALPPIADSEVRAAHLLKAIDAVRRRTGAAKVSIIAHSQGGVDVRVALARGAADKIAVVATLSSPHEGSELADAALRLPQPLVRAALEWVSGAWQSEQHVRIVEPLADRAIAGLSRAGMTRLNAALPKTSPVPFFSLASLSGDDVDGSCEGGMWSAPDEVDALHPLFAFGRAMIRSVAGEVSDDGIVPTNSMRFGTFLGCVPGDHVDWMGWDSTRGDGDVELDDAAFLVELWKGMRDVEETGDAAAMQRRVPRLATLAFARVSAPLVATLTRAEACTAP